MLKVPKTTFGRLLRQEAELCTEFREKGKGRVSLRKHKECRKDPEVEEALEQWFTAVLEKGMRMSGPILKSIAEELAQKLQ